MLHDDLHPLGNVRFMQLHKTGDLPLCIDCFATWVFFDFLIDLVKGVVSRIVLKDIENKAFLNGLLHGVDMECLTLSLGVQPTEQLNRCGLGRGGECKHGNIGLFAIATDLVRDHVFHITAFLLTGAQRHGDCCHVLTSCRGMGFVDDDGETLTFQSCNAVDDVRELLNRSSYNLCVSVQRNRKVGRVALIVHNTDKPRFMLHTHNSFLQLTVNYDSVGDNHDIVKDDFIICIVQ